MRHRLKQHGFAIVPGVLRDEERQEMISLLGPAESAGRRGLLDLPAMREFARSARLLDLVRPHLPAEPVPVRAIFFDKAAETNWLVPWHQDLTIAVEAPVEVPGYGPWSVKGGIPHVQPPVNCLQQMLTVRLHLDDADASNGALRVLPGSHSCGRLSADRLQALRRETSEVLCAARAGDALLMRPLLLHASSRSASGRRRRVLHIEYAGFRLPDGLAWHEGA